MRWNEIFLEYEQGVTDIAKGYILDMLAPLKAQGAPSVTVQQLIDQIGDNPELDGVVFDERFIMQALDGVPNIRIEPDPANMKMTVFLDDVGKTRQVDAEQAAQEKERIRQSAVRQAKKDD